MAATPASVVTVTVNPALDHTVWVPGFRAGEVNRVENEARRAGGKGVNVAARLAELGVGVAATGVLGAENASPFESLMADRGIVDRFVRRGGSTRTSIKVVDAEGERTTDINFPGAPVDAAALTALEDCVGDLAGKASWLVLAGSLPPGAPADLYRRLVEVAHERGAAVALDASGDALTEAVGALPDLIKPNLRELEGLVGRPLVDPADVAEAARELQASGIGLVVVSLGGDGALFCGPDETLVASALPVQVVSTVGAGDAMVAGIVWAVLGHRPLAEIAAVATACSAGAISGADARLDPTTVEAVAATVAVHHNSSLLRLQPAVEGES